ncbi:DUF3667 domain-containing protein [Salinibacter grassmerensis]|uniref:DUF3667 domain-containing protein n=1 Tax=Salinibacter grassmerensis TaxID=3040353 RepID=UPI0021E6FDAD|nr:DUF3667 domain-containing protein [Salinibacter grassmerensis]
MSTPPLGSESGRPEDDPSGGLGDEGPSGQSASDPDEARAAAEDALAQIEAMADLDEEPDVEAEDERETPPSDSSSDPTDPGASSSSGPLEDQCENCGALLHGPYCSKCGQRAAERVVPIWHMLNEALEAVIELDMRVLWTLPKFLFLPGRLTKEYINGRRKRYIRPFRLYLFTTFVLFTVLALTAGGGFQVPFNPQMSPAQADTLQAGTVAAGMDTTAVASAPWFMGNPEQRERWARSFRQNPGTVDVLFGDSETQARLEPLLRAKIADAIRNPRDLIGSMIDRGPYVMFLMLPVFAFLLKLLYIRRGRLYVEHLIFSLHLHAFAFFAFTVGILLGEIEAPWVQTAATWVELAPLLYLVVAMGHVYDQGLIKSTIKAFLLLFVYSIMLLIGFIVLALAAVVLM